MSYYASCEYVDPIGGISLPATDSTQITLTGSNQTITETGCPAATGAVGWIPMITASAGATGSEIEVPVTSSVCTLTTLEGIKPACAIGATATIAANPSSTAKEVVQGTAHTTFAYQPLNQPPNVATASASGAFQQSFGPFAAVTTIASSSNADVAQFYIPAGYFNYLGKTLDICFKAASTNVSTAVPTWTLKAANQYLQSAVTLDTILLPTQTGAVTTTGCFSLSVAATGSSGTFWVGTLGPIAEAINSTGVVVNGMDVTTAVSSALDLTKGLYFSLNLAAGTANITGVTVNGLVLKPSFQP